MVPKSEESTTSTSTPSSTVSNKEMAPKISPTDNERFSSDGSEKKHCMPARGVLSSSRRRVGIATAKLEEKERRASYSGSKTTDKKSDREQLPHQSRRPRKYIQESPLPEKREDKPRSARKYVQESSEAPPSSSKPRRQPGRSSKIYATKPTANSTEDAEHVTALLAENKALEAEKATIQKYKQMYEAILKDPGNAFLFENGSVVGSLGGKEKQEKSEGGEDSFVPSFNVEELIQGLKLKDLLHESCTGMTCSESVSILSEIRQGERTRGRGLSGSKKSEEGASKSRPRRSDKMSQRGSEQVEERVKSRSSSKRDLNASIKSHASSHSDEQRVKSRSNSKRELTSSYKSQSESSQDPQQRRKPSSRRQDPNLASSTSRSSGRSSSSRTLEEEKDNKSVTSNTSTASRVKQFFGRFSISSNASVGDLDDLDSDLEDDIVPDLNSSTTQVEKKEKKGLLGKMNGTMKKFGQKVSKAFASESPFKKYKVGEVARYNIGKIRDSLESFDPCDPTVEVVIVAVHIDAVLEIPYYTIQLPDGSRKQTNMENLIPLEDYNNGARPYARIKEKRSSSRRRSRRENDEDDRSVRSDKSGRSERSNRSVKSSSSRRSTSSRHGDDRRSSSRHGGDDRRNKSYREEDDYRPKVQVDAMRGGGMAAPRRPSLRAAEVSKAKAKPTDDESDDEEPVVIKLTSCSSVGSSFADAAVAAVVGARRSAAMSVSSRSCCSSFHGSDSKNSSFYATPTKSSSFHVTPTKPPSVVELGPTNAPKKSSSFHVGTESRKAAKPPSVVELSPKKSIKPSSVVELSPKKAAKPLRKSVIMPMNLASECKSSVELSPKRKPIKHAHSADDTSIRRASLCSSEQQRRSRSTGPREKSYPHGTCSKCDGCHQAINCPIYLKEREKHKDAWRYYEDNSQKKQMGEDGGNKRCKATRIKQPADGNCLYHSLTYCLNSARDGRRLSCSATSVTSSSSNVSMSIPPPLTARYLRRKLASFVAANPNLSIADDSLKEWVLWDSGQSVEDYAAAMAVSGWGGGVEIAACSHLYRVNIHVYEAAPSSSSQEDEYVRISCFNRDAKTKRTLHLLYHGRNHYDALILK